MVNCPVPKSSLQFGFTTDAKTQDLSMENPAAYFGT